MDNKMKVIGRALVLLLLPIVVLIGINYLIFSLKDLDHAVYIKTTIYLSVISAINSLFFIFHKSGLSLVNHLLVAILSPIFALKKTEDFGAMEVNYFALLALNVIHFGLMDLVTYIAFAKQNLVKVRNFIFVGGGFIAYSSAMLISMMIQGIDITGGTFKTILSTSFNTYLFVGLAFGIGLLVHDQLEKR